MCNERTSPGSASSVAMYSSNHSLTPPRATRTSAIDFFDPPATLARIFRTSNFVSYDTSSNVEKKEGDDEFI